MLIKMIAMTRGCEDGHTVRRFHQGQTYDVAEMLAGDFLRRGVAVRMEPMPTFEDLLNELKG